MSIEYLTEHLHQWSFYLSRQGHYVLRRFDNGRRSAFLDVSDTETILSDVSLTMVEAARFNTELDFLHDVLKKLLDTGSRS